MFRYKKGNNILAVNSLLFKLKTKTKTKQNEKQKKERK